MLSLNANSVYFILSPLIIAFIISFVSINYWSLRLLNANNCSQNIFIAILSHRNNWQKRQTLRQTWIETIDEINANDSFLLKDSQQFCHIRVDTKFIIADKDCPFPKQFRTTPYDCHRNDIRFNASNPRIYLQEVVNESNDRSVYSEPIYRGFSFVIRHSVVVTQLAIHHNFLRDNPNITIALLNARNKEIIKSKTISLNSYVVNEIYYETIEPLVLPKDFYGLLIIDDQIFKYDTNHGLNVKYNENGFLNILRAYYGFTDFESISYKPELLIGPTFAYEPTDPNSIELLMRSQNGMQIEWRNKLLEIEKNISQEMVDHKDILLIDSIDVYRNLAEKVVQSMKFAIESQELTHYMKTDDDCYLNVINIINHLIENRNMRKVWFGNFRRVWPLDYWGKWAENDYESPLYPTFACGSGYVLSADLVQWIASNANYLHRFQGEDVSMGIWLSAIKPNYKDDKRWICNNSDLNDNQSFSFPQLEDKQILKLHHFISNHNKNS